MFKSRIFLYSICLFILSIFPHSNKCEAATLHMVVAADTLEGESSYGTECSIDLMQRQIKRVASYINYSMEYSSFEGYEANQKNVSDFIENLAVEAEDIIVLCFFMHGNRQ